MTIAVVLSTYNGEKYIEEQLKSLLDQTKKPDHVYISDDCSTDKTVEIISEFIRNNSLSDWTLSVNEKNKGWKQNFHDLLLSAEEDIIFPCDQDDIWYLEKIAEMASIMENSTLIDLLACGYDAKYEDNTRRVTKRITKDMKNSGSVKPVPMDEKYMNVLRPGCSYAVRKTFCRKIRNEWDPSLPHDAMLWRCAIINGSAYIYDKNLFAWRRYGTSSSTFRNNTSDIKNKYGRLLAFYTDGAVSHLHFLDCADRLIKSNVLRADAKTKKILNSSREYENELLLAYKSYGTIKYLNTGIRYRNYVPSLKTLLWNVFVIEKAKRK